jgi:ABC-type multidrug transport system fused ATPase/permease subunit
LNTFANFIGTIILIMTVVPFFGVVIVPVSIAFYFVQSVYVSTSRQLKRLESVSRSPIYSHFGETLNGTSTIRLGHLVSYK